MKRYNKRQLAFSMAVKGLAGKRRCGEIVSEEDLAPRTEIARLGTLHKLAAKIVRNVTWLLGIAVTKKGYLAETGWFASLKKKTESGGNKLALSRAKLFFSGPSPMIKSVASLISRLRSANALIR